MSAKKETISSPAVLNHAEPATPGGEYRALWNGTSDWSCLPAVLEYPHDEPGCFDRVCLQWIKDSLTGREPHIDRVGIAYMYIGAWMPDTAGKSYASNHTFHVGPHIMIVSPHKNQDEPESLSHVGSNGLPYAHLPGRTDLFLAMPVRQRDERLTGPLPMMSR